MNKKHFFSFAAVLLLLSASAFAANGQGQTPLAIAAISSQTCNLDGTATITITLTVTSGNASAAAGNWSFGPHSGSFSIAPGFVVDGGDWQQLTDGPVKTWSTNISVVVPSNATYTLEADAEQVGGNYDDVSTTTQVIVTACAAPEQCDQFSVIKGEVKSNNNLAKNGTPVNFTIKGAFGPQAHLVVKNANNAVVYDAYVPRNGNSCVYTQQWIPMLNGAYLAAGTYTAAVTGNDQDPLTFAFQLTYKK